MHPFRRVQPGSAGNAAFSRQKPVCNYKTAHACCTDEIEARFAGEASWTPIAEDGRGGAGEPVELGQDDKDDDLKIELHTDVGHVASANVHIADVWAVRICWSTLLCLQIPGATCSQLIDLPKTRTVASHF